MALKLILLAIGLFLGYAATIDRHSARWPARLVVLVLVAACIGAMAFHGVRLLANLQDMGSEVLGGAAAVSAVWVRRALAFFLFVPIEALMVGLLVGYLTADQQNGAERSVQRVLETSTTLAGSNDQGIVSRLFMSARNNGVTILSCAILVITLFPNGNVGGLFERLSSAKGFGFEISLKDSEVADVAQALRAANSARDSTNTRAPAEGRMGFTKRRLRVFQDLTATVAGPKTEPNDPWSNPVHFIFATPDEMANAATSTGTGGGRVWRIARDQAMIANIIKSTKSNDVLGESDIAYIKEIGSEQEEILSALRMHVACINDVISRSNDNRLVILQNYLVVQHLFELAQHWTTLEFRLLKSLSSERQDKGSFAEADNHLHKLLVGLSGSVGSFSHWSDQLSRGWNEEALRERGKTEPLPNCTNFAADTLWSLTAKWQTRKPQYTLEQRRSPYLVVYAATALAANDDHGAAIRLLGKWLSELDKAAGSRPGTAQLSETIATEWYSLVMSIEIILALKQSEGSPNARPLRRAAYDDLLQERLPVVLRRIALDPGDLTASSFSRWKLGNSGCEEPSESWKQSLVDTYIAWTMDYLDFLNVNRTTQPPISAADLRRAQLLLDININCFSRVLKESKDRATQRLDLIMAAATTRLHWTRENSKSANRDASAAMLREALGALDYAIATMPLDDGSSGNGDKAGVGRVWKTIDADPSGERRQIAARLRDALERALIAH